MSRIPLDKPDEQSYRKLYSLLSWGQAVYYALTGLWAILGIKSFQKVTGPKVDIWLVKTVGVLIVAIGAVLGLAGRRGEPVPEVPLLAVGSAAGLAAIDIIYVVRQRIRPIYLLDAFAEIGLIALWGIWSRLKPRQGA
ncbi:MAG: hypothetical protein M3441_16510 [Chloroflexota bacterium]|nr:hypothetical protein [Chloroflexota bacterium]